MRAAAFGVTVRAAGSARARFLGAAGAAPPEAGAGARPVPAQVTLAFSDGHMVSFLPVHAGLHAPEGQPPPVPRCAGRGAAVVQREVPAAHAFQLPRSLRRSVGTAAPSPATQAAMT